MDLKLKAVYCLKFSVQYPVVSNADSSGGACRLCRYADWPNVCSIFCLSLIPTSRDALGPVPVAARSKASVYGRSPAEIVGSNPTGCMDVCLLWVLCVVR